ncbi:hypothetical protein [Nocardioides rubriscoriae]|uniref:hypothetical protein n=1 Tax=Nocardioides rubriscoriae TaxID=642762 RepID=UPI0011DFE6D3|nr:hypothetical protein [Nocardioides rubriscoriae]
MIEIGSRTRRLPAPAHVVWASLVEPRRPGARAWLDLLADEVDPTVVSATAPTRVVWSSLWPGRPDDEIYLDLSRVGLETALGFTLLTPDEMPDEATTNHLRHRLNRLLFGDLRLSYGQ